MKAYAVESDVGWRHWQADDAAHAAEQHRDAFPDEAIVSLKEDCGHEVFVTDDGIVPTCDLCEGPQRVEGDDWNGETGNHRSCEERLPAGKPGHAFAWLHTPGIECPGCDPVSLCADCEEVTDGHRYHAGCCEHGTTDPMASEDGTTELAGKAWCTDCGSALALTPDEDGSAQWEVMA